MSALALGMLPGGSLAQEPLVTKGGTIVAVDRKLLTITFSYSGSSLPVTVKSGDVKLLDADGKPAALKDLVPGEKVILAVKNEMVWRLVDPSKPLTKDSMVMGSYEDVVKEIRLTRAAAPAVETKQTSQPATQAVSDGDHVTITIINKGSMRLDLTVNDIEKSLEPGGTASLDLKKGKATLLFGTYEGGVQVTGTAAMLGVVVVSKPEVWTLTQQASSLVQGVREWKMDAKPAASQMATTSQIGATSPRPSPATLPSQQMDPVVQAVKLARNYMNNGMKERARQVLEKAMRESPTSPGTKEAGDLLEELRK